MPKIRAVKNNGKIITYFGTPVSLLDFRRLKVQTDSFIKLIGL